MPQAEGPKPLIVPFNGKIADITHADVLKHTLDLAVALGETRKIIKLTSYAGRVAGTGYLVIYPNEGVIGVYCGSGDQFYSVYIIADGTQRLQYAQTVANDDWDLYCLGYVVEV